jgi:hypothetical protein
MKKYAHSWIEIGSGIPSATMHWSGAAAGVLTGRIRDGNYTGTEAAGCTESLTSNQKSPRAIAAGFTQIPARLPARLTLWSEFGLTVFERAELSGG